MNLKFSMNSTTIKKSVDETFRKVMDKIIVHIIEQRLKDALTINWADYIFEEDNKDNQAPDVGELSQEVTNSPKLELNS